MSLHNLEWYGWLLLAVSTSSFLHETVNAAFVIRTGKPGSVSFFLSVAGLATVLWMAAS